MDKNMPHIEIPDELWNQINLQRVQFNIPTNADYLNFCLNAAQTRYCPAVSAIVIRNESEILMVANDYGGPELVWNMPGGAVDPGEDLLQAVARELHEETSITALEIGPLAWIGQAVLQSNRPFLFGFVFLVTDWEGEVSIANEVEHGDVQQARFMPFSEALECMLPGNRYAFRDWLVDPQGGLRLYFADPESVRRVR